MEGGAVATRLDETARVAISATMMAVRRWGYMVMSRREGSQEDQSSSVDMLQWLEPSSFTVIA